MLSLRPGALALLLAFPVLAAAASSPRDGLLVSAAWLTQHIKDPDLVLLHVGDKGEYDAGHIPGARFLSLREISVSGNALGEGLTLELPPEAALKEKLESLGISDGSRIVVYFGKDWVSPATRALFTLEYAGLGGRTSLLDGGQPAWVRARNAVTTIVPENRRGTLSPLKTRALVATAEFVREHTREKGYVLIDARDTAFYDGTKSGGRRPDAPKFGHIKGASSLPFSDIADDALLLRSADVLQERFTKAGVKPGDTVIAYCHIGQQATAVVFAARTLGIKTVLYDGSFEEWANRGYEIENPAAGANSKK
jgi:thiosulfate/3-mercaptopyruvate sulfurtransferase